MKDNRIARILLTTGLILLVPLVAMQFTDEVDWDLTDFIVAGTLLITTGAAYELLANKAKSRLQKVTIGILVLLLLMLIWAELAVGIFGSPWAGS